MKARSCDWPVSIVASSLDVVVRYVAHGYGIGVGLDLPDLKDHRVRAVPLAGFYPVEVVALWRGSPSELVQAALDEAKVVAGRLRQLKQQPKSPETEPGNGLVPMTPDGGDDSLAWPAHAASHGRS